MIKPEDIPRFTGRLEELEKAVGALSADGSGFISTGTAIHSRFQSLSSYYEAPEAEKLFATTAAVQTTGESLGSDVESVARALGEYANEIRPLVARLDDLRKQAIAFVADAKSEDGLLTSWQRDQDKADKNKALVSGVTAASIAFWDAERTAANKIMALFSCIKYQANDGSNKSDMYGYSADALKDADLPWGTVEERTFLPGNIDRHIKSFVWDGLILDNIVGTVQGLGALVGIGADASDTWNALGRVFLGAGDYVRDPHNERPGGLGDLSVVQESRKDAKEFAKGLVAWDMWSENPTRASATVVFNVLTLGVGPLKAGTAAKAGLAAKTAGTAAKIGGILDPVSATIKAAGAAAPKIAEITAGLRKAVPDLPNAADGSVRLPEGYILRADGELVRPDGSVAGKGAGELSAADRAALDDASRIPERTPAGLGADAHPRGGAGGGNAGDLGSRGENLPGEASRELTSAPSATPDATNSGSRANDGGPGIDDMGTRRDYEARVAPESTIPYPPKAPGDYVMETGDPVYFRRGSTAIGYDRNTMINYDLVKPLPGYHDVVIHGNNQGFFEPGRVNEAGVGFSAGDTHPSHIANAIRSNPDYRGGPVRLMSCHTGTVGEGAEAVPAAQAIANELGVPVMAPTNKVGVSSLRGPGQIPKIADNGYWRTFLPLVPIE